MTYNIQSPLGGSRYTRKERKFETEHCGQWQPAWGESYHIQYKARRHIEIGLLLSQRERTCPRQWLSQATPIILHKNRFEQHDSLVAYAQDWFQRNEDDTGTYQHHLYQSAPLILANHGDV